MLKSILVPASASETDAISFECAWHLATIFDAHLDFLHVRLDSAEIIAAVASVGDTIVSTEVIDDWEREAREREAKAETFVRDFCALKRMPLGDRTGAASGPAAEWHSELGREADWVVEYGRTADLMVIGRSGVASD